MQDNPELSEKKEISVLMPVYNGDVFLRSALESILAQSFSDFEYIIIDDASTDKTADILEEYAAKDTRIRIFRNERNLGLTASLNLGISHCRGKYIARMDADDVAEAERFMSQYWFMEEHPDLVASGTAVRVIDEDGKLLGEKTLALTHEDIKRKMLFNNQFIHSTLFFRTDVLKSCGGYDEKFKKSQDYELMLRLSARYPLVNLREKLLKFRLHGDSLSWTSRDQQKYAIRARWLAITKYKFPFFSGIWHIFLRVLWMLVPTKIKMIYKKKRMQDLLQQI
ncbi:MAG: hypothetical protein A3B90_00390 [Candidatus Magasanikbacteria bacterium RIFCSPHIGHO2_02_FULL_41_13]|uniref:Glycosyltransferase 2-like domain-containing protein n=1 Tax=Candidatus Magasanikbacteria bacterium RIFCSPHIGHO2_02_FULL_41_13 TaxID=1798676 RepID=A0A1F6M4B2_9BACT|nr:MAG: hypothetical protein A3B90_00390 [Candidatus Magasanikbacteria bacterium RIFCSPHIGHO2_02_FULL_41_13]